MLNRSPPAERAQSLRALALQLGEPETAIELLALARSYDGNEDARFPQGGRRCNEQGSDTEGGNHCYVIDLALLEEGRRAAIYCDDRADELRVAAGAVSNPAESSMLREFARLLERRSSMMKFNNLLVRSEFR